MDSLAALQEQNRLLQQQNEHLRSGKANQAGQAEFLRQQQAHSQFGAGDQVVDADSHDWYASLYPQQAAAPSPPPPDMGGDAKIQLTKAELNAMIATGAKREVVKSNQAIYTAEQTAAALRERLVKEAPDLAYNHAPIIDRVWKSQLAQNPKFTPEQLYQTTLAETQQLVDHVRGTMSQQPPANNPYGVSQYPGGATPPWVAARQAAADPQLFQDLPGNERPDWLDNSECKALNRYRQSKALNVYVPQQRVAPQ